jgi:uncharacterized membrane protein
MMLLEITKALSSVYYALNRSLGFMLWNTFLALIPWLISQWLFRSRGADVRRASWWAGLAIFIAFLPNAPYVLTDIIHLVRFIQEGASTKTVIFVMMPQYFLFMLIGMEAYVVSLINLGHYLQRQGKRHWISPIEFGLHALCAFGIYLGRFPRFNSWDLLTNPTKIAGFLVQDLFRPWPWAVMVTTFVVIAALYWPLKHISLAVMLYWRQSPRERSSHRLG